MKRKIVFSLIGAFLFISLVHADEQTNKKQTVVDSLGGLGLEYKLINNKEYSVNKGKANAVGTINIPESYNGLPVTSIGSYAFAYCSNLTNISIPNSVTSIGDSAFYRCSELISVTIPKSATNIGIGAFADCSKLNSITIPNEVFFIDYNAFYGCSRLTNVTMLRATPVHLDSSVFLSTSPNLKIHVPNAGAVSNYQRTSGWSSYFTQIVYP